MSRAIPLEITDHRRRVLTQVPEVDSLTALTKQQKSVEGLEQLARRLMYPVITLAHYNMRVECIEDTYVHRIA